VVGKVINGRTLKNISESMVVFYLMANFPPICKKDTLEAENPPKRPKKEKAFEKLKSGASEVPLIQEEVQDLNPEAIISKKTRSGKADASASTIAPGQTLQKKKRTSKPRKLKESVYVTEEVEDEAAATELVTR